GLHWQGAPPAPRSGESKRASRGHRHRWRSVDCRGDELNVAQAALLQFVGRANDGKTQIRGPKANEPAHDHSQLRLVLGFSHAVPLTRAIGPKASAISSCRPAM